jgi:hypothetical protein
VTPLVVGGLTVAGTVDADGTKNVGPAPGIVVGPDRDRGPANSKVGSDVVPCALVLA